MSGGKLQKYRLGVKTNKILGGTHNQLVEAEMVNRQRPAAIPQQIYQPKNPVAIELVWEGEADLPIGAYVALREPVYFPADRPQAPFEGIRFRARKATAADVESGHFAITSTPVKAAAGGKLSIGHGWIPAAVWAQVDVGSAEHKFADAVEGEFILASGESGRFPIVWKPEEADGIEWCVVLLAAVVPGGGETLMSLAMIVANVDPAGGFDSSSTTISPGQAGDGGVIVDLEKTEDGVYKFNVRLVPSEEDPDVLVPYYVDVINISRSPLRGSASVPIIMGGHLSGKAFVPSNWDMASLSNHEKGTAADGAVDDAGMQIPYHPGGTHSYRVDSRQCTDQPPEDEVL